MKKQVIPTFPQDQHEELFAAANSWRFPYWDWAAKKRDTADPLIPLNYNIPDIVLHEKITVRGPKGSEKTSIPCISSPHRNLWVIMVNMPSNPCDTSFQMAPR